MAEKAEKSKITSAEKTKITSAVGGGGPNNSDVENEFSNDQSGCTNIFATGQSVFEELKSKRKSLKGKITRSMNRVYTAMRKNETNSKRFRRELDEIRRDYTTVCQYHGELYDYYDDSYAGRLDQWETDLTNDLYAIEEEVEEYIKSLQTNGEPSQLPSVERQNPAVIDTETREATPAQDNLQSSMNEERRSVHSESSTSTQHPSTTVPVVSNSSVSQSSGQVSRSDSWIDELVEFQETVLPSSVSEMSVADALYRIEASRDIPTLKLSKFDGNPLNYVEFIDKFKIHIHEKPHLTDDVRLIQLKMHLTGEAERSISGLGSAGSMYATACKTLKEQFGQSSSIARAHIHKVTKGGKISNSDRQGLRDLSIDVINCIAVLEKIQYFSDVNAKVNLIKVIERLPDRLMEKWKNGVPDIRSKGEVPSITHVSRFLRKQVTIAFDPDFGEMEKSYSKKYDSNFPKSKPKGVHAAQNEKRTLKCFVCLAGHRVSECPTFLDSSVEDRFKLVSDHRLCFSCLVKGHRTTECRSKVSCGKDSCTKKHHHLLHTDQPSRNPTVPMTSVLDRRSMLPVVRVLFRSHQGGYRQGNVLVDSGAGTSIIRRTFARALGLQGPVEPLDLSVVGGDRFQVSSSRRLKFWVSDLNGGEEYQIEAHDMEETIIRVEPLDRQWLKSFSHLSDLEFSHKAGPVDLILGVQYSHLFVDLECRIGSPFEPIAKRSLLGWFVMGSDRLKEFSVSSVNFVEKVNLDKFYDFETLGVQAPNCTCPKKIISSEDQRALDLLKSSCHKENGRYVIALPWKKDPDLLPNNYSLAEKRLLSLEKSLQKNPSRAEMYAKVISDYESNGWAVKVSEEELRSDIKPVYYLPHHGVYRADKPSTPLRVVFDPASPYGGVSLNSFLYKGPCLIGNLLGVLIRFREEEVAIMGDISKMFLQICLPDPDTHVHRFLWRNLEVDKEPVIYRLVRVTFGDKSSPDMASYVMLHLADTYKEEYPLASEVLERDRYMDDLIHSCSSEEEASNRIKELDEILNSGSFKIKEWYSSSEFVRRQHASPKLSEVSNDAKVPRNQELVEVGVNLDGEDGVKTLGIGWNPYTDTINFEIKGLHLDRFTKRNVLSKMSMLYDPLGLASPVTIKMRVSMQDIWRSKQYDWDDCLPDTMVNLWKSHFREIESLNTITFPRCLKPQDAQGLSELHIFTDASITAYGAAAYIVWSTLNGKEVRLVAAKARVAPLRQSTIPRLELMAMLVGSRLASTIIEEFKLKPGQVHLWSDSKIVLHWIRSESVNFKAFVGVRVSEIQSMREESCFHYVPTDLNVADDLSRGIPVKKMSGRWMQGPSFLRLPKEEWPKEEIESITDDVEKKKSKSVSVVIEVEPVFELSKFSSLSLLFRVTAYCLRFVHNLKSKLEDRVVGSLQPQEIENAETYWISTVQKTSLHHWEEGCKDLAPFKENSIVRVGGRLRHSPLSYDQNHPVLLPGGHYFSRLIMIDVHWKLGHVGSERTLGESRKRFWILKGRNLAKSIVQNCVVCRKLRQPAHSTLMADLPSERLQPMSPPFTATGVDLFGPFSLKYGRNKTIKAWGAIFTCATVRAIHLEIVYDLSTQSFLMALRRFVAYHGWPSVILSDNGSNFIGAEKELRKFLEEGKKQIEDYAVLHRVKWKFSTPLSPHQGGIYESLIKQVKRSIRVAIGNQTLNWNEMSTVFAEVSCLINSRPIGYSPDNPNDLQPITPNHFIIGRSSIDVPQGPFVETKNLRKRFEFVQRLVQQFWNRFIRDYMPTLMRRSKWRTENRQIAVNDVVLLVNSSTPRGKWDLARVIEVYPGSDGIVRNMKVKTKTGEFKRSVQKCCLLLASDDN